MNVRKEQINKHVEDGQESKEIVKGTEKIFKKGNRENSDVGKYGLQLVGIKLKNINMKNVPFKLGDL